MSQPTALEQYMLELVNDARLDPMGNAARYITSYAPLTSSHSGIGFALSFFGVGGAALQSAFAALTPAQPLAWSSALNDAAAGHNAQMIAADQQSHQVPGEASLGTRATNAGYTGWNALGENVYAFSDDVLYGHAGFMVDWGSGPDGMQSPAGHRNNIMSTSFREIGVSITMESNPATSVGPMVITEDFGRRNAGPAVFVLGVAYNDADNNDFYSVGEGLGTLSVSATGGSTTSAPSGGYTLGLSAGATTVTLTGAGLTGAVTVTGNFSAGTNIKLDVVDGTTLLTSGSVAVSGPVATIQGLGILGLSLTGDGANQSIIGTDGADTLSGLGGADTLDGGAGADSLNGGEGDDTVIWDAGDNLASVLGGNGTDALRFSGAAPTTFDLAAHGFENAFVVQTDSGGNAWRTITSTYAPGWQQSLERVDNDDNSFRNTAFDATGALGTLHRYTDYFNAVSQRTAQEAYNDGAAGTSYLGRTTVFYAAGQANYIDDFNTSGTRTSQEYFRADGTRQQSTVWDAAGSLGSIDFYQDFFSAAGVRTSQTAYYDGRGNGSGAGVTLHGQAGVDYMTTTWTDVTFTHGTQQGFDQATPSVALYTFVF